ncbi:GNAT family N-acetyltransferase [Aureivirga marina]|uniref:GNAT family N-acetyltransferase n=1 Tax=Aureivirga marina TaxID=1182451 RepID=UPI0018CA2E47|nr:GNAT family N-acetyltransferase [Aureivirga marina]
MIETKIFDNSNKPSNTQKEEIIDFLFKNLEEYGDPKNDIRKAIDYSLKEFESFGGYTLILRNDENILGAVVINKTGMGGYIPENILVYIATHQNYRGQGLGKKIMNEVIQNTKGDIALHVEASNPARFLYEKVGFTNPYLEMRLKK